MPAHIHLRVADVAKEMAHQLYNTMMEDNIWYASWKASNPTLRGKRLEMKFVEKNWPRMVGQARATLSKMLADPNYSDSMKEEIYEALLLDNSLKLGRGRLHPGTKMLQ